MAKKYINWKTKGMNRDMSVSAFNPEFAFENVNLRLATNEGNTMMSWVNERGTQEMTLHILNLDGTYTNSLVGMAIGTAVLNHKLVVFTVSDTIYVFEKSKGTDYDLEGKVLYHGILGFNPNYPIETLVSYESENIQKVYWTDNLNQPRVVNIAPFMDSRISEYTDHSFDFVPELALHEEVQVTKIYGSGEFPSGVIQYAFTYYNKYRQESNIFYTTPLQYISYVDRGGAPDSKIANAFKIMVTGIDSNFDYIRIYSILRTSKDATPVVKRIQDIEIPKVNTVLPVGSYIGYNSGLGTNQDSEVLISVNGGATFVSADRYEYSYADTECPSPSLPRNLDAMYWGEMAKSASGAPAKIYKFSRKEIPSLILKVNDSYYTWGEDSEKDAVMYLGLASHIGVLVGENEDGSLGSYIYKYNVLPSIYPFITYIDTGLQGETVDPTELLYKGGEEIKVKTMEQKDGTLFLGNLRIGRPSLNDIRNIILEQNGVTREHPLAESNVYAYSMMRNYKLTSKAPFVFINTLDGSTEEYKGASCFKSREYYRLGVQFQYKNGKWSEPCWIGDKRINESPYISESNGQLSVPEIEYNMGGELLKSLYEMGYRRARPLFAAPNLADRTILCQGIGCPTMYRNIDRDGALYGSASWLFRTPTDIIGDWNVKSSNGYTGGGYITDQGRLESQFDIQFVLQGSNDPIVSPYLSSTEIMGTYDEEHKYRIDRCLITLNSPDIEFDSAIANMDFKGWDLRTVGYTPLDKTYGDIDIQTSTPTIGSDSSGFIHKSVVSPGSAALISGLYYEDYLVDDLGDDKYSAYHTSSPPVKFPIFMWHKNGSLNNDVSRSNRSANLLKKKISNYRLGGTTKYAYSDNFVSLKASGIQLFNADFLSVVKVNGHTYQGNVDTMVSPSEASAFYFAGDPWRTENDAKKETRCYYKLRLKDPNNTDSRSGIWKFENGDSGWTYYSHGGEYEDIGDKVKGLSQWREGVSIKYKSSPHIVAQIASNYYGLYAWENGGLGAGEAPIIEVYREYDKDTLYGGTSDEALQAATWIPCGPVVSIDEDSTSGIVINYKWGDTYLQRFECLKTYPFTQDDKNQVIEIASFICETRVNIDGRYDRNRAQVSNLNMTPQNFNLINPVYSQMDNFFSYKMLSEDDYENTSYPNTVTWTKTKQNGADVDLWTNVTLANTLEMDGNKGTVNKLTRLNNQLICFQDKGISQILYNENTQISTTEGVPIEIANSEKVQGKRYYSDTVGCSNKWSVVNTPSGIYFMDSNDKSIYLFNGQLANLSIAGGFNSWAKQNIPSAETEWNPNEFGNFVSYYDNLNQDVMFIDSNAALAFSEKFNCFTSFYDYGGASYFESLDDIGIWVKDGKLWKHRAGDYCKFFGENKPFSMTLVANQEPQLDKIFTNLEFRACVEGEGVYDAKKNKFVPSLPFDSLEVWNEYQHGMLSLSNKNTGDRFTHGTDNGILARKFRMWACDIPRDNAQVDAVTEAPMGIKRFRARPLDRIRNPWSYVKLTKKAATTGTLSKTEVHDIMATYFV